MCLSSQAFDVLCALLRSQGLISYSRHKQSRIYMSFTEDRYVWFVVFASVGLTSLLGSVDPEAFGGYVIGYELLPLNGLFTFLGLVLIRSKKH